ncbi:hypothetical protein [Brucella gallinifaecis]|uniref:hypothetical protein n=1 Tax=Brucella gallinifaecis TaxID=215590 RepID=UPI00235F557C|nr:hypothetical protein [Brucella gallinifaecis]
MFTMLYLPDFSTIVCADLKPIWWRNTSVVKKKYVYLTSYIDLNGEERLGKVQSGQTGGQKSQAQL